MSRLLTIQQEIERRTTLGFPRNTNFHVDRVLAILEESGFERNQAREIFFEGWRYLEWRRPIDLLAEGDYEAVEEAAKKFVQGYYLTI